MKSMVVGVGVKMPRCKLNPSRVGSFRSKQPPQGIAKVLELPPTRKGLPSVKINTIFFN
jgi:hypothetical protein